jgi:hypothetical protein
MALACAGVTDEAEGLAFAHPLAGGQGVDDGRVNVGVGCVIECAQGLLAREGGGSDAAFGAPTGAIVTLGEE